MAKCGKVKWESGWQQGEDGRLFRLPTLRDTRPALSILGGLDDDILGIAIGAKVIFERLVSLRLRGVKKAGSCLLPWNMKR